jgi:hypothetical protein
MTLTATALLAVGLAPAEAAATRPSFKVVPQGFEESRFNWKQRDYVARCAGVETAIRVKGAAGWTARVGSGPFRAGGFQKLISTAAGKRTTVEFRDEDQKTRRYYLRCLPVDFPEYEYARVRAGGPKHFSIQLPNRYGAIFDRHGVPVWWYQADGEPDNIQVLDDKTVTFDPVDQIAYQTGDYEIRTLGGRLLRVVRGANGASADIHEILLRPNGNYVIGAQVVRGGVDTTAFGGSANSSVIDVAIQEQTPAGDLVYSWNSGDHTTVAETGRWWNFPLLDPQPYDVSHWNSVEYDGPYMYLSFRHLDAVYKVDRRTGQVVWKLGGTQTPQSLEVVGDARGDYPFGGQHDARVLPDGTITIFDNSTGLADPARVVRYRIDEQARTATLVEEILDPTIPFSLCCGSARKLASGDWLVSWGGLAEVAGNFARTFGSVDGYDDRGRLLFELITPERFTYRAIPLPEGLLGAARLRDAMDRIY